MREKGESAKAMSIWCWFKMLSKTYWSYRTHGVERGWAGWRVLVMVLVAGRLSLFVFVPEEKGKGSVSAASLRWVGMVGTIPYHTYPNRQPCVERW